MDVGSNSGAPKEDKTQPDLSRRGFVGKAGKALYLAPTLVLLGTVQDTAAVPGSGPPCPPGGCTPLAPTPP
jgi:hypothetical protein